MSKGKPFRIVLSGPGSYREMILTVCARELDIETDDAADLTKHLQEAFPPGQMGCWRPNQEYGYNYVYGHPDQDVTPFLRPLAEWLEGRNVTEVVVVKPSPDRLAQIRNVFPDVAVH